MVAPDASAGLECVTSVFFLLDYAGCDFELASLVTVPLTCGLSHDGQFFAVLASSPASVGRRTALGPGTIETPSKPFQKANARPLAR